MPGGPDDRPVQPSILQYGFLVGGLVNKYRVILDEPEQLHRRRSNSQNTSSYPPVKTPRPRRDYHKGPSNIRLLEPVRDKPSGSLFLESCSASDVIPVSMGQKNQLNIARLSAKTRYCFQYPLLTARHPCVDEHQSIIGLDQVGIRCSSRYPIDPFSHFQQC